MTDAPPNPLLSGLLERLHQERDLLSTVAQDQRTRTLLEARIAALEARFKTEDLRTLMKAGVTLELSALQEEFEALRLDEGAALTPSVWLSELAGEEVTLEQLEAVLNLLESSRSSRPPTDLHSASSSLQSLAEPTHLVGDTFEQGLPEQHDTPHDSPENNLSTSPSLEPLALQSEPHQDAPDTSTELERPEEQLAADSVVQDLPSAPSLEPQAPQGESRQDAPDDSDELERLEQHLAQGAFPRHLGPLSVWLGRSEAHLRSVLKRSRTVVNVGMDYFGLRSVEYALTWPELELFTRLLEFEQPLPISSLLRQASLNELEGERMVGVLMAQANLYRCEWRQGGLHFSLRHPLLELFARWQAQPGERPAPLEVLEAGLRAAVTSQSFAEVQQVLKRLHGTSTHAALLERFPALLQGLEPPESAGFTAPDLTPDEHKESSPPPQEGVPGPTVGEDSSPAPQDPVGMPSLEVPISAQSPQDPSRDADFAELALLLSPQYYPLLERIRLAGLPCPDDCHKDIFYKGQTTNSQALLVWTAPGLEVMLSDFEMQPPGTRIIRPNHPQMIAQLEIALRGLKVRS